MVLKASKKHTATLIFLHGLGDTGMGWAGALNSIKPDYLKVLVTEAVLWVGGLNCKVQVVCPTAPMLPVTLNGGMKMPAWYDIRSLEESDPDREDMQGVDWAVELLHSLVAGEQLPSHRVMLGGFSQGGAVSLRAALTTTQTLAGCIALSCYLPGDSASYTNPASTPVFQAGNQSKQQVLDVYCVGRRTGSRTAW